MEQTYPCFASKISTGATNPGAKSKKHGIVSNKQLSNREPDILEKLFPILSPCAEHKIVTTSFATVHTQIINYVPNYNKNTIIFRSLRSFPHIFSPKNSENCSNDAAGDELRKLRRRKQTNKQTNKPGERKTPYQIYSAIISGLSSSDKLSNSSRDDMATKIVQNRLKTSPYSPSFARSRASARVGSQQQTTHNTSKRDKQSRQRERS